VSQEYSHEPVMLEEILEALSSVPTGLVIDATVGGAGHAQAILERYPDHFLLGLDRDETAARVASERLARFGQRARVQKARFGDIAEVLEEIELPLSAALFDLGISSHQIDRPERGFSFMAEGPIDMRMDQSSGTPASVIVNEASERELDELIRAQGEERLHARLAKAIIAARPISTTTELAAVIEAATPAALRRRGHPARRVFQALRIAVNDELDQIAPALDAVIDALQPGGRVIVLSYHSGEDRLVKARFRLAETGGCVCPPGLDCVCGAIPLVKVLTRGARMARPDEIARNPRASAARLRIAEKLAPNSAQGRS
jgi:16S rRNA (cytosine1402-N4)-methyltransferase